MTKLDKNSTHIVFHNHIHKLTSYMAGHKSFDEYPDKKLKCEMDVVPHLTQWKLEHVQAVETRVPGAPATMTAEVQEPPSKRQRVEATAAQTQKQAKIDAMKLQNRQDELDLKLDLQLQAEEQKAHELAQMKDALIRQK